jgi:glycosyltransferase involved in cell wall biosynthesis
MKTRFTIISSTYNAEAFIERLFTSIENQTYKNFEWYLFDDDSKDNTVEKIEKFIEEHPEIDVYFTKNKPNKGLLFGYLEALKCANGEYLLQWDHDDIHKPNELEVFNKIIQEFDDGKLAGVWALCEDQFGNLLGNQYPNYVSVGNYFTHFKKYITKYGNKYKHNERMPCINISKLRELDQYIMTNYPNDYNSLFPTFRWALLSALGNKIVFINEVVRTYFVDDSIEKKMTRTGKNLSLRLMNTQRLWINIFIKHLDFKNIYFKLSTYLSYVNHGILSEQSFRVLFNNINPVFGKIIFLILYPPIFIYLKKVKKIDLK